MTSDPVSLSRRGLLACAAMVGLTACARDSGAGTPSRPSLSPSPSVPPSPSPSPTSTPFPAEEPPGRAAIVAKYAGRAPTQWGSDHVTGLVRRTESDAVVLTFDGCGGPEGSGVDDALLDLLDRERIPAVLFLNQRWIGANRGVFDRVAAQPELFEIANHGTRHLPLSVTGRSAYSIPGTRDAGEVYDEVMGNHLFLTGLLGHAPRWFRTGTAWYDEVAIEIVRELGEIPIGFDVNGDGGSTYPTSQVVRETGRSTAGSIVLAHLNQPRGQTAEGMAQVLPRLRDRGTRFTTLSGAGLSGPATERSSASP